MPGLLGVWLNGQRVGTIRRSDKVHMTFAYAPEWMETGFPLSLSLSFRKTAFGKEKTRAFFDNLLPEQGIRARVSKQIHVSEKNTFGFLKTIGGECAGALTILPDDEPPPEKAAYEHVTGEKLGELISLLPKRPLLAGEDGIRLSLAGAQNKIPMAYLDGVFLLPLQGAPSTHIIKPPIDDLEGTIENEAFCMALAKVADIDAPKAEILDTYPRAYMVRRYDRVIEKSGIRRIHQEDFCQAMGLPAELKYQNDGGPGTARCMALADHCENPEEERIALFAVILFNFLIGNTDAHAKNFSLLYAHPPKPGLAPFYDLMCMGVYLGMSKRNAMKIGGRYDPEFVRRRHWVRLAKEAEISEKAALNYVETMAAHLPAMASITAEEFLKTYGKSRIVPKIVDFINARCRQVALRLQD